MKMTSVKIWCCVAAVALALNAFTTALAGYVWTNLNYGTSADVEALAHDGATLYAGGEFMHIDIRPLNYIARWNGTSWNGLGTGMDGYVWALVHDGTSLYAGGNFTTAGGVAANRVAKWNGLSWTSLGSGFGNRVFALAHNGTNLYAGGLFTNSGGMAANYVAVWNGASWTNLGIGMNDRVRALAHDGTNLYAGGNFTTAGGVAANYIAMWNGASWTNLGSGMDGHVLALVHDGRSLYAGGEFRNAGGVTVNYVAKWNGRIWTMFGSGMDGSVRALDYDGTNLYAGGNFTTAGGVAANYIAMWNGASWTNLDSGMSTNVCTLTHNGLSLYAGGEFMFAGGVRVYYVAMRCFTSIAVLGTNMAEIGNGEAVSAAKGTDFGSLAWGGILSHTLTITNGGGTTLVISGITTNGAGASAFRIAGMPSSIPPGHASNFSVQFAPANPGFYTAAVLIANSSLPSPYIVNLAGTYAKQNQTITNFPNPGSQLITNTVQLYAQASSGLPISFMNSPGCPVIWQNATTITFCATGVVNIVASQAGDANWNAAPNVTQTFNVVSGWIEVDLALNGYVYGVTNTVIQGYNATPQVFVVYNSAGPNAMFYQVSDDMPWLMESPASGSTTGEVDTIVMSYSVAALNAGTYHAVITVVGTNELETLTTTNTVSVTLVVRPLAKLGCDGVDLQSQSRQGHSPASAVFTVWNASEPGTIAWTAEADSDWLAATPASGTSAGEPDTVTLNFDTSALGMGRYRGHLTLRGTDALTGTEALQSPKALTVDLAVLGTKDLDFLGDGNVSDLAVYQESTGNWYIQRLSDRARLVEWMGGPGYLPAPGDYDGDGRADLGIYRPENGAGYARRIGSDWITTLGAWGSLGCRPVPGDYDGDGRTDFMIYQESSGTWYLRRSSDEAVVSGQFGGPGFSAQAGDFDGDGASDAAIYDEASGRWYIITVGGVVIAWDLLWGGVEYTPVTGDFDGDRRTDVGAYREDTGLWFMADAAGNTIGWWLSWGAPGHQPVAKDYDGDGVADMAVYETMTGRWYIRTVAGAVLEYGLVWGGPGFTPAP